ncbi:TetR/AcrR family transcriptional regulator [Nocardia abscessus]|uniref:TetR/AcrR family transcriptional regulator n=1 Tax=Nocardia TaxID=1817 RepID=UPI001893D1BD|nr:MULTISPECIES: TetR/AcrR family transcriptional regulator [Nocardia]MBF6222196.1 TetR/AcrR family transcriptional regulator [Nocardia abscessus]MDE1672576.1 TetR/AcrR family transcriptional regulator [Nocardia gipuzkoensis]
MTKRKYDQAARAEAAVQTRRRILDAVAGQLRAAPTEPLSLDKVAKAAGVSRSTIYVDFGSRAGLFDAFVADLSSRTGLPELTAAVDSDDARAHLRGAIAAASRMKARDPEIYRVLHAMDRLDPSSAAEAVRAMEEDRRGGVAHLAHRLAAANVLREDVSEEWATDVLWMVTSFESLDLLITGRGLPVEEAIERLIVTAERTLCRPAEPGESGRPDRAPAVEHPHKRESGR